MLANQINGQHISWLHLTSVKDKCTTGAGLSMLPEIKFEHLRLNSYSRMKVYLASQVGCDSLICVLLKCVTIILCIYIYILCVCNQVLSTSFAKALEYYKDPATKEIQRFCQMFDHFFDCLNVQSYTEGRKKRKPDLLPYRTIKDTRFKVTHVFFFRY